MTDLKNIVQKISTTERLSREDGLRLLDCSDILAMGQLARKVKKTKTGEHVFFNVNCHINLTNICIARCSFCAFSRDRQEQDSYTMTIDQVLTQVQKASDSGITEVHMVSGLHPDRTYDYYLDIVTQLHNAFPAIHIKAFTPVEIQHFSNLSEQPIEAVLDQLKQAGLQSLPGGGAEVLSERVRKELCPNKADAAQWLSIMKTAHRLGLRSNATLLFGHLETNTEIIDHLLALRELQDETGGFQTFIPLPFHPENTGLQNFSRPTAFEMLKLFSLARLMLDNFDHIKAYWVMTGLKVAQLALYFGADDIDGTVTEEKITHAAGAETAQGLTRQELIEIIRQTGYTPVQRDTLYEVVEKY
ncbi:MAG: aminofutalosine synthase MqnE [Deltaproteobacteria bacterium]|nr:aminofutalosine synthase MqnE [Deltaproteobacteria bacterium]